MPGKPRVKPNDPRWEKLIPLWLEEGLTLIVLGQRFQINEMAIRRYIFGLYGRNGEETLVQVRERVLQAS